MSEVAQSVLEEFGRAVKRARSLKRWTLDELGSKSKPAMGKSFLSNVEKGKRPIGSLTVGKLIHALDLPESWIDRFLDADIAPEDEETARDRAADRLIRRAEADPDAPPTPETLLLQLAEEWAGQRFFDPGMAYTALKGALQVAADMRAQGALPSNASAQFQAVMRRVSELNDEGEFDAAAATLTAAIERNEAEAEALHEAALKQERLRNDPAAAAKRLIARLRAAAPPGGLFNATQRLLKETRERGERQGDPFDLVLALELARANHDRAKGPQLATALHSLGICHFFIGERQSVGGHLTRARKAFEEALRLTPRERDPLAWAAYQESLGNALSRLGERTADHDLLRQAIAAHRAALTVYTPKDTPINWATLQSNFGNVLQALGERTADPNLLRQAVDAHRAALTVRTPEDMPMDWARSQNNLGFAQRWLGAVTDDAAMMDVAAAAYAKCLTQHSRDEAPFPWAMTQWNLADLALARHALSPDAGHLATARHYLALAREVFAEEGNDYQLAECNRLQALIDAG